MEYRDNVICVTREELTYGNDPIIKDGTFRSLQARKQLRVVHRGGGEGNRALIVYSSLPEKYRARFEALKGDPAEILKQQELQMKTRIKTDEAARTFYEDYRYEMGGMETSLSDKLKAEYTLNASVLGRLIADMDRRAAKARALNNRRTDLWDILLAESEQYREEYGHTLPANLSRLKAKIRDFRRDGYAALISGKVGNVTAVKITQEAGEWLIAHKRSRTPVYTDARLFEAFNQVAPFRGWKPLKSIRSMVMWLNRPEVKPLWFDAVHGELASRQLFNRKHRTELPGRRDSLWYGDGTKLNLYYMDEQGKVRTTMVYEVVDAYSEVLLGYHISDYEDYEAQYHAYRMAIQTSGHKPYEIVHDNQGGHQKLSGDRKKKAKKDGEEEKSFLDKICHIHRPTAPYNGQSKTIENIFCRFQQQELSKRWGFTGMNITTKKATSHANLEFSAENKDSLPTLAELKEFYAEARRAWNEAPHPATGVPRIEMYEQSVNEETDTVTVDDMVDMFWLMTEHAVTFTASGITLTLKGKKLPYEVYSAPGVPDHEWRRQNTLRRFYIAYDPYDLRSVRLYWKDRAGGLRFSAVAEPYRQVHRAIQDQTEGEAAFIRQEQEASQQDRVERQVAARLIEYAHGTAPEQNGLRTPKLKGGTAAMQRQIEKRTKRYSQDPDVFTVGRMTKETSNLTLDQLDGQIHFDQRKVAGKL